MTLLQQAGAAILLVTLTLFLQCGGAAALIIWIRSIPRETGKVRVFRCAGHANHRSCHHSAWNRYSAVGELLSLAVPSVVGICVLFLREQLCHSGIRGCDPSVEVAAIRTTGKHGRHADGRCIHWPFVRGRYSPGRWQFRRESAIWLEFPDCGSGLAAKQAPLLTARDSIERPEFVKIVHHQKRGGIGARRSISCQSLTSPK